MTEVTTNIRNYYSEDSDGDEDFYKEECDSDSDYHITKKKYLVQSIWRDNVSQCTFNLKSLLDLEEPPEPEEPHFTRLPEPEPILCPAFVMYWICFYGSRKIATALLQGQTCVSVDLNVPFSDGNCPLYMAASGLDCNMVDLLVRHGARTDVTNIYTMERNSRPLNASLEILNNHLYLYDWTPEESIYKLVIILCLPQMKGALETNRVLASSTKDVMAVFIDYAKEGKLIEMAVLLMVAKEHVMPPSTGAMVEGGMGIHDIIMDDILSQGVEEREVLECNSEKRSKLDQMSKGKRPVFTLLLLKIFEKTGDTIQSYLRSQQSKEPKEGVVKAIASILKEAGFVLKEKDIDLSQIDCESDSTKICTGTSENDTEYNSVLYFSMILSATMCKVLKAERQEEFLVKESASILKEIGFVLKEKDIDLSNKICESDEIKEVPRTSTYKSEFSDMLRDPFDDKFLNAKLNPLGWPPNYEAYRGKVFARSSSLISTHLLASHCFKPFNGSVVFQLQKNQIERGKNAMQQQHMRLFTRSFSSSTHLLASRCFKPFNSSVVSQLQKNQIEKERNAMQRHLRPSKSRNILATLALSFKWGMRHI